MLARGSKRSRTTYRAQCPFQSTRSPDPKMRLSELPRLAFKVPLIPITAVAASPNGKSRWTLAPIEVVRSIPALEGNAKAVRPKFTLVASVQCSVIGRIYNRSWTLDIPVGESWCVVGANGQSLHKAAGCAWD